MEQELRVETSQGLVYALFKRGTSSTIVVMLHGLASSLNAVFFPQIPDLTCHSTLRFDLAGHGRSSGEFEMLFSRQALYISEVLAHFGEFERRVFIGHSKGAALAFLAARSGDSVVSVAGRWNMSAQPASRYSADEMQRIQQGETIVHEFSGKMVKVNIEQFREREQWDYQQIAKGKSIDVTVIAALHDAVMPREDAQQMAAFFGTEVHWCECGHSGFRIDMVKDALTPLLQQSE